MRRPLCCVPLHGTLQTMHHASSALREGPSSVESQLTTEKTSALHTFFQSRSTEELAHENTCVGWHDFVAALIERPGGRPSNRGAVNRRLAVRVRAPYRAHKGGQGCQPLLQREAQDGQPCMQEHERDCQPHHRAANSSLHSPRPCSFLHGSPKRRYKLEAL